MIKARFSRAGCFSTFLLSVFLFAANAPAQSVLTIFSNLGPGDSYNGSQNTYVFNYFDMDMGSQSTQSIAMPFIVPLGTNFTFDSAFLAVNTSELIISLALDSSGSPGAYLETINGPAGSVAGYTFTSLLHPTLTAGDQYWIVAEAPAEVIASWYMSPFGNSGPSYGSLGDSWVSDGLAPGTRVDAAVVVPEPSTVVLAGLSLLLGVCLLRRRNPQAH